MQVAFERSGGFAGMVLTATIDTDALPPGEAQDLHRLVESSRFFDLPAEATKTRPGADQFCYKVTVETGERRRTLEIGETAAPEGLQPLLQRLTAIARSKRRR